MVLSVCIASKTPVATTYVCLFQPWRIWKKSISKHLRRWLGLPPSFSNIGLYSRSSKLTLPLSSVVEEFKIGKVRAALTLSGSADKVISRSNINLKTGRKWSTKNALDQAESRLQQKKLIGTVCQGRQGLGLGSGIRSKTSERSKVLEEVRAAEEETRHSRAVQMGQQGAWTQWNSVINRDIKWNDLWKMTPLQIRFLVRSVYDVLPTPSNLCTWGLVDSPNCAQCGKRCTLSHILSSCPTSLAGGKYLWRHNQVLKAIVNILSEEIKKLPKMEKKEKSILFNFKSKVQQ